MGRGRRKRTVERRKPGPIALDPVDLLAGLAPGLELHADDVPASVDSDAPLPASTTVAEAGRLIRAGDGTIRRLIRTQVLRPADRSAARTGADPDRAGVLPRTREKPGE
jgi:hypothetical protein